MTRHPLVARNVRATLRRFATILVVLGVGAATLLAVAGVAGNAVARTATSLDSDSALSILEVDSVSPRGPSAPITTAAMEDIAALPGVEAVAPYAQFGMSLLDAPGLGEEGSDGLAGVFWATPRIRWVQPAVVATASGFTAESDLGPDEVLLPDTYLGTDLTPLVGQRVVAQYTRTTGPNEGEAAETTLHVVGVYDNSQPGQDGESALYVSRALFDDLLAASLGTPDGSIPPAFAFPSAFVKTASSAVTAEVQAELVARDFNAENLATNARALPGILGVLKHVNSILGVALLGFCVAVGVSIGGTWSALRRWDVGLLTALGWRRSRIARAYGAEVLLIGTVVGLGGAAAGCLVSVVVGWVMRDRPLLGAQVDASLALPPPGWLLAVVVGVPVAMVLGSLPRILRLADLDPEVALRRRD